MIVTPHPMHVVDIYLGQCRWSMGEDHYLGQLSWDVDIIVTVVNIRN